MSSTKQGREVKAKEICRNRRKESTRCKNDAERNSTRGRQEEAAERKGGAARTLPGATQKEAGVKRMRQRRILKKKVIIIIEPHTKEKMKHQKYAPAHLGRSAINAAINMRIPALHHYVCVRAGLNISQPNLRLFVTGH